MNKEFMEELEKYLHNHEANIEDMVAILIATLIAIYGYDLELIKNHFDKTYKILMK
jgi:hypothetical protein